MPGVRDVMEVVQTLAIARSMKNGDASVKGEVVKEQRVYWVLESLHMMTEWGWRSSVWAWSWSLQCTKWKGQWEKQMTRWGEENGVEQDPGASQKQEGRLGGRVLEAAGKDKQTASHLLAWGTDKWHKEVKFHLLEKVQESSEKVMGSKHSRSPWRIKGNLMTTSRRSRGWSEGWFHFCFC